MKKHPDWQAIHKSLVIGGRLECGFREAEKITDKWGYIRQLYMELMPDIVEIGKDRLDVWAAIYPVDWSLYFSPPEAVAWESIRDRPMVLYPQFPLFNYFIDFAHPSLRIGLEIDGKDFHDPKKDLVRDDFLGKIGWRIFRVPAREANTKYAGWAELAARQEQRQERISEDEKQKSITDWLLNSLDGVVEAIFAKYFLPHAKTERANMPDYYHSAVEKTLKQHRYAKFPLSGTHYA